MITIFNFFIFIITIIFIATFNDLLKIKTEKRLGIRKKPFLMFIRYSPAILNSLPSIIILYCACIANVFFINNNKEFILMPLLVIVLNKMSSQRKNKDNVYFDLIGISCIILATLPALFYDYYIYIIPIISGLLASYIFNINEEEPNITNLARTIALNFLIISTYIIDTTTTTLFFIVLLATCFQKFILLFIPAFNEIRTKKLVFSWTLVISFTALLINVLFKIIVEAS